MDEIVEAMARALYEADDPWHKAFPWPIISPDNEGNADAYRRLTRAALAVAAPMVLDRASKVPQLDLAGPEIAVEISDAIRDLKETFNDNG